MASPSSYENDQKQDDSKKILFRFCSECSNLLFPREDKAENKLLFACRTCSFAEEAPSSCVMRHEIASTVGDTAGVTSDIGQDPTVGLSRSLSHTSLGEAFPTLCTMCGQDIVCEECGEESAPGLVLETEDEHELHTNAQLGVDKQSSKK
ncbi:DNA-directed RNA polymeras-like protein II subunit RPB9 [Trematosphaeria pertusa]|uniref:DNA-directed RNA polymeras-like protein II subunit RPB9 n=1 Tax=Trematosphaeria pertusa TaxID=390896 RepID=A0A6A6IG01_9PLEO|nr:DNA-directed RNA polymeras-like protein II subunit RPB9 [Trematosphaeria pertusa]KAF2248453.1 DNA-directed RNA polymeras-like protein II subunit RPB9 [Trematosphaeria pertusa]